MRGEEKMGPKEVHKAQGRMSMVNKGKGIQLTLTQP